MNLIDAYVAFDDMEDAGTLPVESLLEVCGETVDGSVALAVALASLSGRLDECQGGDDLLDALQHGWCLLNGGVFDEATVEAEVEDVLRAIIHWGERAEMRVAGA